MRKLIYGLAAVIVAAFTVGTASAGTNLTKTYPITSKGGSHETGTITFQAAGMKTKVTIAVKGEPAKANQPAHIHAFGCKSPGAVTIPLMNVVKGSSVTIVDLPLSKAAVAGTSVNIHKSAADLGIYVACGDIK